MKAISVFLAACFLALSFGCSSATKSIETYPQITIQNFNDSCGEPSEYYAVPPIRFPIPAQVIRHKGCMGISDLLTIAFPGEASDKNLTAVKLLMLMYLEHQSEDTAARLLKIEKTFEDGLTINMAFYELSVKAPIGEEVK